MATKAQDAFTEASDTYLESHTPDVGTGWVVSDASEILVNAANDKVTGDADTGSFRHARETTDIGDDDMDVSLLCFASGTTSRRIGVCGRIPAETPVNNLYRASLRGSDFLVELEKVVGGVATALGTYTFTGNTATLKLEIRTAAKKVYVDGVERISTTDDSLIGNQFAGLFLRNRPLSVCSGDDFLSESIAAAEGPDTFAKRQLREDWLLRTNRIAEHLVGA